MTEEMSADEKKKAVYDAMSPRRQKHIREKVGYDKWDPFEAPKDPIDIRKGQGNRTAQQLVREFLQSRTLDQYSNSYGRGVLEIAIGLVNDDDRFLAMYDFSLWHRDLIERERAAKK
ncbi:hypothetical protein LJC71_02915 [Desulfosarcina sp. OttesenSCG-928-A07]|nr:hypothetical protein [Desulfosarcina sp. OttesenSCG-928-G17]MDL2328688.1 hypothetical protein [Desulfosarcina sp. OttesenSCG-928-A07]